MPAFGQALHQICNAKRSEEHTSELQSRQYLLSFPTLCSSDLHRDFLIALKTFYVCGDYYFVHAGIRPGIAPNLQREDDLLWIRNEFLRHEEHFDKIIVHGHTPVLQPEIHPNRINIDTGAYATGILTCLMLEADKRIFI